MRFRLALLRHDFDRKVGQHITRLVRQLLPDWLVTQALLKASRHIRDTETVPEVPFMAVYERQFKREPAR
jgi:hypothetical protein